MSEDNDGGKEIDASNLMRKHVHDITTDPAKLKAMQDRREQMRKLKESLAAVSNEAIVLEDENKVITDDDIQATKKLVEKKDLSNEIE